MKVNSKKPYKTIRVLMLGLFICQTSNILFSQSYDYSKQFYTTKEGLSQNQVTSILSDNDGFMWFGTWGGGLNKFDGYTFTHYKPFENNPHSVSSTSIEAIFKDSRGLIWIGTKNKGLDRYNPQYDKFYHIKFKGTNDSVNIWDKRVISFCEDNSGNIWFGTWGGGIFYYNYKSKKFKHYLNTLNVYKIIKTRDGKIWAGTYYGLYTFHAESDQFIQETKVLKNYGITALVESPSSPEIYFGGWACPFYKYDYQKKTVERFSLNNIYALAFDQEGLLFVGTWGYGLHLFNTKTGELTNINLDNNNYNTAVSYNTVLDIYPDNKNNIWIGIENGGVCKLSKKKPFSQISRVDDGLTLTNVSSVVEDCTGNIWIGSYKPGLFKLSGDNKLEKIKMPGKDRIVYSFYKHPDGRIWFGIEDYICELEWKNNNPYLIPLEEIYQVDSSIKLQGKPTAIIQSENHYWIGFQEDGLLLIENSDRRKLKLSHHFKSNPNDKKYLSNIRISTLFCDHDQNIWVGTYGGLHLFNKTDSTFIRINDILEDNEKFVCDIIHHINQDCSGNIWVATPCGLHKLIKSGEGKYALKVYTKKDGFPDDIINAILSDDHHYLWISHNSGISKFDPSDEDLWNFSDHDGLLPGFFNINAAYINEKGKFFFGGENGVVYFDPVQITDSFPSYKMAFSSLSIWNNPVTIGQKINNRVILPRSLNDIDEITLTHKELEFSFEIALLDFSAPEKNQYAFMLEGRDDKWNYIGNRRCLYFSNLSPGKYKLRIKGSNSKNRWSIHDKSMRIIILPPWWKTWFLRTVAMLILIISIFLIYFVRIDRIKKKNLLLENKVKQRTKELLHANRLLSTTNSALEERHQYIEEQSEELRAKTEELAEKNVILRELVATKDKFFSIIAHDLKNPFNHMNGFLELLLMKYNKYDDKKRLELIKSIHTTSKNTFTLLENLLHWANTQMYSFNYDPQQFNISEIIASNIHSTTDICREKELTVHTLINDPTYIYADKNMVNTVIRNLLNNAIKYTDHGSIEFGAETNQDHIVFHIKDTGLGMKKDRLDKLFSIISNKSVKGTRGEHGTGLGLIICKEFIVKNGGKIYAESEEKKGSVFYFSLPVKKAE